MSTTVVALGVDSGSTTAKIVGVDAAGEMVWHHIEAADPRMEDQARRLVAKGRLVAGSDVDVVATGYGRKLVKDAVRAVTEITCHAKGVFRAVGHGGTLVDIGGQDAKVIVIDQSGAVPNFAMNDRCAAGTGRFLEVVAGRLQLDLSTFAQTALSAEGEVPISSTCTVFAESEVISLIANGEPLDHIVRGLHRSLLKRIASLARSAGVHAPIMLSGGVARSAAIPYFLGEALGSPVEVPPHPQLMGAYGAALISLARRTVPAP